MKLTQLLLLNQNNQQCIRSGYCCIKAPCIFGSCNKLKTQCKHLKGNKPGKYYCDIKNEIVDKLPDNEKDYFGAGCSSTLNPIRTKMLTKNIDSL